LPQQLDAPNFATAEISLKINRTVVILLLMTPIFLNLHLSYNKPLIFGVPLRLQMPISTFWHPAKVCRYICVYNYYYRHVLYGYPNALEYLNKHFMREEPSPWRTVSFINIYKRFRFCPSSGVTCV